MSRGAATVERVTSPLVIHRAVRVGATTDPAEAEADAVADRVMRMPVGDAIQRCGCGGGGDDEINRQPADELDDEPIQAKAASGAGGGVLDTGTADRVRAAGTGGQPLAPAIRQFFEPRFGTDLSQVRTHSDSTARQLAADINARAFTTGRHIFFGPGEPPAHTPTHLLAHELTHTLQQAGRPFGRAVGGRPRPIRRAIELRPPGPGEASAFDRAQELVDRLNTLASHGTGLSPAVTYRLDTDGQTLLHQVSDEGALDEFDRRVMAFIDDPQVIPLRLITKAGRVAVPGGLGPAQGDRFQEGYVDLDDLLGADDGAFRVVFVHFMAERLSMRNYGRRLGTFTLAEFNRAHAVGRDAERDLLRGLLDDASVVFSYEELRPNGTTFVRGFRSRTEGYRVFLIVRNIDKQLSPLVLQVLTTDGRRITLDAFMTERAMAGAAGGGP